MENAEQLAIISDGLERLSKQDKEIFIRFYYYGERLAAISGKWALQKTPAKQDFHAREKSLENIWQKGAIK